MGELGLELNALMHQGWAHAWVPMCRYLRGEGEVAQLCAELKKGLNISIEVDDLANQCAALNHLANVAVREHQVEESARLAVQAFDTVWRYQVLVPFLQIGLVDAAEAALFALEQGATSVPRSKLLRIVRLGSFKARALSRLYPYMKGPALRVTARSLRLRKGMAAAEPVFLQAIEILEKGPNRWELGVACFDAAVALPHRRAQLLARAREIFTAIGARAELRRVQRLEVEGAPLLKQPAALPSATATSAQALRLVAPASPSAGRPTPRAASMAGDVAAGLVPHRVADAEDLRPGEEQGALVARHVAHHQLGPVVPGDVGQRAQRASTAAGSAPPPPRGGGSSGRWHRV